MTVPSIEAAARRAAQAQEQLKTEIQKAISNGIPTASAARAAGLSRTTVYKWLRDEESATNSNL